MNSYYLLISYIHTSCTYFGIFYYLNRNLIFGNLRMNVTLLLQQVGDIIDCKLVKQVVVSSNLDRDEAAAAIFNARPLPI